MANKTYITGFPRIGENRELKKALEGFWAGEVGLIELEDIAYDLRKKHWLRQKEAGIDFISVNDFSFYDNMLDTQIMLGAIPERFAKISDETERYFAMARGNKDVHALGMTKWFNTNYHYMVPELDGHSKFKANTAKIRTEYEAARAVGINPKINIIGPITFLALSKYENTDFLTDEQIISLAEKLVPVYEEIVKELSALAYNMVLQIEESVFVKNPSEKILELLRSTYTKLCVAVIPDTRIVFSTYFESSNEASKVIAELPVWALALDFVHGAKNIDFVASNATAFKGKKIIAGVVDGRNIWVNDFASSLATLTKIADSVGKENVIVGTSCSLLHTPYTVANEPESPVKQWLSFACEKLDEVALIAGAFSDSVKFAPQLEKNKALIESKASSSIITDAKVTQRMSSNAKQVRDGSFAERIALQKKALNLPELATTTIGSFPQTPEIRKLRSGYKTKKITQSEYESGIKAYIDDCIAFQESIGLDVLVHGEPERNDMVEYFGEMLKGFHFTKNGWVQSYGSRCVKPPVIFGDISRPNPMTVEWIRYAQSKTQKIMKGMLTGPVTILNWSFVRNDKARSEVAKQIAYALCDEINDLQNAGIRIIQVDEAAFREGYPLKTENRSEYEKWAVDAFRLAVSMAKKETQIHSHMCYSEFTDSIKTIEAMDADVITIETARGGNVLLRVFKEKGYANEIGPGVYDIHSPRIPPEEEFVEQIKSRLEVLPRERMWVNPDCGLKTRKWDEVKPALQNMVSAAKKLRS